MHGILSSLLYLHRSSETKNFFKNPSTEMKYDFIEKREEGESMLIYMICNALRKQQLRYYARNLNRSFFFFVYLYRYIKLYFSVCIFTLFCWYFQEISTFSHYIYIYTHIEMYVQISYSDLDLSKPNNFFKTRTALLFQENRVIHCNILVCNTIESFLMIILKKEKTFYIYIIM